MFEAKEIKTKPVGEQLREARTALKLSLKDVSRQINIPIQYLEQIETGEYSKELADVYIIAYLKKYAQFLSLDPQELINKFKTERKIKQDQPITEKKKRIGIGSSSSRGPIYVTPKRAGLIFAVIIIVLIFGYLWHQLSYIVFPPKVEVLYPKKNEIVVNQKEIEIYGQTEQGIQILINGKRSMVDAQGYFKERVYLNEGLNELIIEAKDLLGRKRTIEKKVIFIKTD